MTTGRTVAVNTAATYARMVVSVAFGLLATRLLFMGLGASRFGLLAAIGSAGLLTVFLADALASAAQRDLAHALGRGELDTARRRMGTALRVFPVLAAILLVAGILFWPLVASWLTIEPDVLADARGAYLATIVTLAFTCAATPFRALLAAGQSLWLYTLGDLALSAARLVSVLGVWLFPQLPLTGVGVVLAVCTAASCAGNAALCRMRYPSLRGAWRLSEPGYGRELIGLAGWTSLSDLAWQAQLQGSAVAMNAGFGNAVSAGFAAGQQLAGYQSSLTYGAAFAARPAIVQLTAQDNRQAARELILNSARYATLAGALFSVPLACEATFWLKAWLTRVPTHGAWFLVLLLAWRWILGMGLGFDSAVLATRKLSRYVIAIVVVQAAFLLTLVASVASGRASAQACAGILVAGAVVQLLLVQVRMGGAVAGIDLRAWWSRVCRPSLAVAGSGFGVAMAGRVLLVEGWPRALLCAAASCAVMIATAWGSMVEEPDRVALRRAWDRLRRKGPA